MRNTYFKFQQFIVHQDKSAMKVCTDSCLFGAWVANIIAQKRPRSTLLDIGTGTGLLALMIAQKNLCQITAVEINKDAYTQAADNFQHSPWAHRLQAIGMDVKLLNPDKKFDWIVSNPPFFENDLKSDRQPKNLAKHHEGLSMSELLSLTGTLLAKDGHFALLVPARRAEEIINLAEKQSFFLEERVMVKQTPRHPFFRGMVIFTRNKIETRHSELTITNEDGFYTKEFNALLKDYYLL